MIVAATTKIETRKLSEWQGKAVQGTMGVPDHYVDCSCDLSLKHPLKEVCAEL